MYKPTIRLQVNILVLPSNFATYNHTIQSAAVPKSQRTTVSFNIFYDLNHVKILFSTLNLHRK